MIFKFKKKKYLFFLSAMPMTGATHFPLSYLSNAPKFVRQNSMLHRSCFVITDEFQQTLASSQPRQTVSNRFAPHLELAYYQPFHRQ